jgi:RNA polymerase sigma-70 factor (ECF subfamily)
MAVVAWSKWQSGRSFAAHRVSGLAVQSTGSGYSGTSLPKNPQEDQFIHRFFALRFRGTAVEFEHVRDSFGELLAQVRDGNREAAARFVEQYEPYIRRAARNRLRNSHLRRVLDSVDICQSVLSSLFNRAAQGQYALDHPEQLERLLLRMVRNKVIDVWRRYNVRILGMSGLDLAQASDSTLAVDEDVCRRELIELAKSRLSEEELDLFLARAEGTSWDEIAKARNKRSEALRKQLARALDRVTESLRSTIE